jgi:hypothetical protein
VSNEAFEGSCLCGAVTYRVKAPFKQFAHCHCGRCRKATGTGHATNLYAEPGNFEWVTGAELTVRFDLPSAKSFSTTFCRTCGSPLSLDTEVTFSPRNRIFWDSRVPWASPADGIPTSSELPEGWR